MTWGAIFGPPGLTCQKLGHHDPFVLSSSPKILLRKRFQVSVQVMFEMGFHS